MYFLLVVLMLSLTACSHELKPAPKPDTSDTDRDGGVDSGVSSDKAVVALDRQMVKFGDFSSPSGCGTTLPASAPTNLSGDCKSTKSWTCNSKCKGFHRFTCFKGKVFQREIRCNQAGLCDCKVGATGKPTLCTGVPVQDSRSGCARCKEVLIYSCCRPK